MPPAQQVAAGQGQGQDGQQQQPGQGILGFVLRMGLMWYVMSWMRGGQQAQSGAPGMSNPLYRKGDLVDMYVYLSEEPYLYNREKGELIWKELELGLATSPERQVNYTYHPSQAVQNNGSLYVHAYFIRSGYEIDTPYEELPADSIFHKSHSLIMYMPKPKNKTGVNLLQEGGSITTPEASPESKKREIVSFLKPNITIGMVDHFQSYSKQGLPPQLKDMFVVNEDGNHYPFIYFNDFWMLRDKMVQMNDTVMEVQLALHVNPMSFWWMQLQQQMEQSFSMQINTGLAQDGESDEIKRIFLEGNPYLLAVTMVVSMFHTVFDFLAFKNDVTFWKENKSMEGLSARSIMINAVCQLVIFLYLLDNETSMVVLFSSGVGCAIEFWKVTKAFDVSIQNTFPYLSIKDKASYDRHDTKRHDADAIRYLSYALYPLVIGYSVYALMYETHRSWYSWILGSLVGAVYTFGFILMCPQLYLNYKLKSVAHLPWRQMTYKFLNTIIDDLFAFVIKMPTLHRLSVFRDDIIFLIFLYQRYIYRVDPTRVNEFGFSGEEAEKRALREQGQQQVDGAEEVPLIEGGDTQAAGSSRRKDAAARPVPEADAEPAAGSSSSEDEGQTTKKTRKKRA